MDLTIIIPVYNVGNHLSRCLDSIFVGNTIDGDFEVIAVDDGSSDNSYDILQEYASRHKQLKIYHQENQGSSVARNKALDAATGKYIMFVDSDDFLTANSIQPVVDYIKEKDLDLLFFDYTKISSKGEQECRTCPNLINGKTYSSQLEASKALNISRKAISLILKGEVYSFKGLHFEYINKDWKNTKCD